MKFSVNFLIVALLLLFGCNETMSSQYANYQEAKDDDLFKRGWVPDVLPTNTGPIEETHNVDTNERCAEAVVPVDSIPNIEENLLTKGYSLFDSSLPDLPSFRIGSAKCTFELENISNNRTALASETDEIAVLDIEVSKFYYWSF